MVRYHYNQSKYALSEEADEPNSKYQPKPQFLAHKRAQIGPKWANMSPKNFQQTKNSQLTVKNR